MLHKSMKGGLSDSESGPTEANPLLTAYVVLSLLKSGEDVQVRKHGGSERRRERRREILRERNKSEKEGGREGQRE